METETKSLIFLFFLIASFALHHCQYLSPESLPHHQLHFQRFLSDPLVAGQIARQIPRCFSGNNSFGEAIEVMRSKGFSVFASFLETQLIGFEDDRKLLAVFAPSDTAVADLVGNFTELSSVFLRHVVSCEAAEMRKFRNWMLVNTYSRGFVMRMTRNDSVYEVNGVPVTSPAIYHDKGLLVHGLPKILPPVKSPDKLPGEDLNIYIQIPKINHFGYSYL